MVASEAELQPERTPDEESGILELDEHTVWDLDIFASGTGGESLFEYCNFSRTQGGARALRRRMEQPWSRADRIRHTQESIAFILDNRPAFDKLPSAYGTSRAEYYAREILPVVTEENAMAFSLGALSLWANHDRHYSSIANGVHVTCGLMRAFRRFAGQPELDAAVGELGHLVREMRMLLARPRLAAVPDKRFGAWMWRILRLDQVFRLHEKAAIARLLALTYEVDALVAMADATRTHGFVLPHIESGPLRVHAQGLKHPLVENAVGNPVDLDQQRPLLFLTGPNMAGKTTYLRAFATALYLAHLGMGVPASSFAFVPAQRLLSSISLSDDLASGISYFRAEALRVKAIAQSVAAGYRVIAVMDEPFKGTNIKDAFDASLAILERFAASRNCLFMFSSHLIELNDRLTATDRIHCRYFEAEEGEGRLRFDYRMHEGVSDQRLGMRLLREEGIFDLLDRTP